jgi:hypothetical protein
VTISTVSNVQRADEPSFVWSVTLNQTDPTVQKIDLITSDNIKCQLPSFDGVPFNKINCKAMPNAFNITSTSIELYFAFD